MGMLLVLQVYVFGTRTKVLDTFQFVLQFTRETWMSVSITNFNQLLAQYLDQIIRQPICDCQDLLDQSSERTNSWTTQ